MRNGRESMKASVTLVGDHIRCSRDGAEGLGDVRIPFDVKKMVEWATRYDRAVCAGDPSLLLSIGSELFSWIDQDGWASAWVRGTGNRILQVTVEDPRSDPAGAVLDLPWELLADSRGHLAADVTQPYVVYRSIGATNGALVEPTHGDLALMFMAAAPEGLTELDYEAEEVAIDDATAGLPLHLLVEESGSREILGIRLSQEGPFEAVHISCHGTLRDGEAVLALESLEGDVEWTTPATFIRMLGETKPALVFVSACRTAETDSNRSADATVAESFVRALVRSGALNVLGWDGSVYDGDATSFARTFYQQLASHQSVPYAAAVARSDVLCCHQQDPHEGQHWHLARVYTGPGGGGPLCCAGGVTRTLRQRASYQEFLGRPEDRVPVATAKGFVGRRRHAQRILRAFRAAEFAGVLIHGMGRVGKSSLAARVANRMPHRTVVVVFDRYDALSILHRVREALPPGVRETWASRWRPSVAANDRLLKDSLEDALCGPLRDHPILLVIDDLEQILEEPCHDQIVSPVKAAAGTPDAYRNALAAVLQAFDAVKATTQSRLLLTSRYRFTLPDGEGGDLAERLTAIPLPPMRPRERQKQWRALKRVVDRAETGSEAEERGLVKRVLDAAGGNPGLQVTLSKPILASEFEAATNAVAAVERWRVSGDLPTKERELQEFFERISLETYVSALTEPQTALLRAATLFSEGLPIPMPALREVGRAAGVVNPDAAASRLLDLGLLDAWGVIHGVEHASATSLVRPLMKPDLRVDETAMLAAAAVPELSRTWKDAAGRFPPDPRAVETARLGLAGSARREIMISAALAAGSFLFYDQHDAKSALALLGEVLKRLDTQDGRPTPELLLLASNCAERIGETSLRIELLERGITLDSEDEIGLAQILATYAEATMQRDGPKKAIERLREAITRLDQAGDERSATITKGKIADILYRRGELDEALRIRQEEELPVYERLGDVRSVAVTKGKIADILESRGELDEALRIRQEEQLPVYERLGDLDGKAHVLFSCARCRLSQSDGRPSEEEVKAILRELVESFAILKKLERPDGIAAVGPLLGQLLTATGRRDLAERVFEDAIAANEKLGLGAEAAALRGMQAEFNEDSDQA